MRRAAAATILAVALVGCGAQAKKSPDPFTAIQRDFEHQKPAARAAPRWEPIASLNGSGGATRTVRVAKGAIQWRVRCTTTLTLVSGAQHATCDRGRPAEFIGDGQQPLLIDQAGPWRVEVDQQVETALHEPAPAGRVLARADFRSLERPSRGTASVYRLASGRLALRLAAFQTSANSDLFVWLSRARDPRTTRDVLAAPHTVLGSLKSTLGDQNYKLPRGTRLTDLDSVVIWCDPVRIAYAAAPLRD